MPKLKDRRIPAAGIPRFPGAGSSARGQPDPKARPKGVVDGHRVNIPEPGKLRKGSRKKVLQGSSDSPDEGFARIPRSASTPPRKAP